MRVRVLRGAGSFIRRPMHRSIRTRRQDIVAARTDVAVGRTVGARPVHVVGAAGRRRECIKPAVAVGPVNAAISLAAPLRAELAASSDALLLRNGAQIGAKKVRFLVVRRAVLGRKVVVVALLDRKIVNFDVVFDPGVIIELLHVFVLLVGQQDLLHHHFQFGDSQLVAVGVRFVRAVEPVRRHDSLACMKV